MNHDAPADDPVRAAMPADVEAPDKVLYGLTFRQLAILAVTGVLIYGGWHTLRHLLPAPLLAAAAVLLGGLAFGVAVGRRDALPLDQWLRHAITHQHAPKALSTLDAAQPAPPWVQAPGHRVALPAPLTLPAQAVDDDGQISLDTGHAAMVATTTVNLRLRTPQEQAALIDAFGRWLNSLSTPTQIVVSARPFDLASHADNLAARARHQPHPALAAACADHAEFLHDLAQRRDPLHRHVLVVTRTGPADAGRNAARRKADDTARALSSLGVTARALDGAAATAALAAAADPYQPPRPGRRATPTAVITGTAASKHRKGPT